MTERDILTILGKRYKDPEYALLPQLRNGTGYSHKIRTADAVAMSLWPSRGVELHGFEIKTSRSDWLRELKTPKKGEESIIEYMDRWWIVVPDNQAPIVRPEELPPKWGLQLIKDGKTEIAIQAPLLDPRPPSRHMLASILRKAKEQWNVPPIIDEQAFQLGVKQGMANCERQMSSERNRVRTLEERIAEFQRVSGVKIDHYAAGFIGEAVNNVFREQYWENLGALHRKARAIADNIGRTLEMRPLPEKDK